MKKLQVLIVDDSIALRFLLREILRNMGHDFVEATNGLLAIEKAKENFYDIIFMDIEMPEMNGVDAASYIRNELKISSDQTPIVALTAYEYEIFIDKYPAANFDEVLTKPYTLEKITDVIQKLDKVVDAI